VFIVQPGRSAVHRANGLAERMLETLHRQCLDHVIVLNEGMSLRLNRFDSDRRN